MMTNAKRRKPWQGRVSDYRASDLTVRAWCEKNGVTENELRYWLARIDEESPGSERCEVEPARAPRKAVAEAGCVSRRRSIGTGQQSHCAFDQAVRDRQEELALSPVFRDFWSAPAPAAADPYLQRSRLSHRHYLNPETCRCVSGFGSYRRGRSAGR